MAKVENYTTTIDAARTAAEVQVLLAGHGASRIAIDYAAGQPVGLTFQAATRNGDQLFSLPIDVDAMHRLLKRESAAGRLKGLSKERAAEYEQARRVAWRVIKEWIAAQMTLVAADMASLDQVLLPYLTVQGRSLYEIYVEDSARALTAGGDR